MSGFGGPEVDIDLFDHLVLALASPLAMIFYGWDGRLLQATRTVPIAFVGVADPGGAGFVDSLSRRYQGHAGGEAPAKPSPLSQLSTRI